MGTLREKGGLDHAVARQLQVGHCLLIPAIQFYPAWNAIAVVGWNRSSVPSCFSACEGVPTHALSA